MHTPFAEDPPPEGVPPLAEMPLRPWDIVTFTEWGERRQEIKTLFQRVVLQ
jgi:hypothetical protein